MRTGRVNEGGFHQGDRIFGTALERSLCKFRRISVRSMFFQYDCISRVFIRQLQRASIWIYFFFCCSLGFLSLLVGQARQQAPVKRWLLPASISSRALSLLPTAYLVILHLHAFHCIAFCMAFPSLFISLSGWYNCCWIFPVFPVRFISIIYAITKTGS